MMIEYVEIRDINRVITGIIDDAISILWHSVYFGVGDFEIYATATPVHLEMLKIGNYVTRLDNPEVGVIEAIEKSYSQQDGEMITVTGRFAKSILDRRHIFNLSTTGFKEVNTPTILKGNVETAVREVVNKNCINCTFDNRRNFGIIQLGTSKGYTEKIVDESGRATQKQVSYDNLLTYTDSVLEEYGMAARITVDNFAPRYLLYEVYKGTDRSSDNTAGNEPIIFSQEFDNLTDTLYSFDTTKEKNAVLIGGEGEGINRIYSYFSGNKIGMERRETWENASSINRTLKADVLHATFPSGIFYQTLFRVDGVVYANLVTDLTQEYSLSTLQNKFPTGVKSGSLFKVSGTTYARLVNGEDDTYNLTAIGYKGMLDADDRLGDYLLVTNVYQQMLNAQGKQTISTMEKVESFSGTIDISNGQYKINEDFELGDIITIQDNTINKYINCRIKETLEAQDENGYKIEAVYE